MIYKVKCHICGNEEAEYSSDENQIECFVCTGGCEPPRDECLKEIANEHMFKGICSFCGGSIMEARDEDLYDELCQRADVFGMESLRETEQLLIGVAGFGQWCQKCYDKEGLL